MIERDLVRHGDPAAGSPAGAGGDALVGPAAGGLAAAGSRKITVSHDSIARLWRRFCLQPHRTEGFKFSTDPQLEAKVRDVVGLYLTRRTTPSWSAWMRSRQCQALERTQPILPMRTGHPRAAGLRLRPARGDLPVRRAGDRHRAGHGRLLPPAPPSGVPEAS